jgi:hypothetical protein
MAALGTARRIAFRSFGVAAGEDGVGGASIAIQRRLSSPFERGKEAFNAERLSTFITFSHSICPCPQLLITS